MVQRQHFFYFRRVAIEPIEAVVSNKTRRIGDVDWQTCFLCQNQNHGRSKQQKTTPCQEMFGKMATRDEWLKNKDDEYVDTQDCIQEHVDGTKWHKTCYAAFTNVTDIAFGRDKSIFSMLWRTAIGLPVSLTCRRLYMYGRNAHFARTCRQRTGCIMCRQWTCPPVLFNWLTLKQWCG